MTTNSRPTQKHQTQEYKKPQSAPSTAKSSSEVAATEGLNEVRASHIIEASPNAIFSFLQNLNQLTELSRQFKSLLQTSENTWEWEVEPSLGPSLRWALRFTDEVANRSLTWQMMEGAESAVVRMLEHDGRIELTPLPKDRGTMVVVKVNYKHSVDSIIKKLDKTFLIGPEAFIKNVLHRMASLIETGEVPTIEGQSRGGEHNEKHNKEKLN